PRPLLLSALHVTRRLPPCSTLFPYTTLFRSGYIAAGAVGRLVDPRGRSRSTENIKVPESLRFLRDSMVATALSMVLMYLDRLLPDRKSTRLNSSHVSISYAVFCLKKKIYYGS